MAAIGIGVFAGIALLNYVRGIERDVYDDAQPVNVLIATADIPAGTAAADAFTSIEITEVPLKIRPATFISPDNTDPISGLVAQSDIPRNQIIVAGLFVDPTVIDVSLRDQIPEGTVAFSMEVDTIRAVGGYLQPGDEVNILVNHQGECVAPETDPTVEDLLAAEFGEAPVDNNNFGAAVSEEVYCTYTQPARYLYQRVEILAIGARQALQTGETSTAALTPRGGTITFIVPNEAAQILASVSPEDVYLTLLPDSYTVEPLPALTADLMLNRTPAEISGCATPYGPDGFIEGDSALVGQPTDAFSDFIRGHCAPIWTEDGE
jgi:pilus assembly protein CpaB